jgi:hypothetical protein
MDAEFAVVGTIHKGHLIQPAYPLGFLCRMVAEFRPDLVLVEIRPEAFAEGHLEDGPFEMTAVTDCAQSLAIPVEPIDWWLDQEMEVSNPPLTAEQEVTFGAESAALKEPDWPSFIEANSYVARQRGIRLSNLRARYLAGNPAWTRRQAWIDHQALQVIERHRAHRVLAFVGYNHAPELEAYLWAFNLTPLDPLQIAWSQPADSNQKAPESVVSKWREGLARLRTQAEGATGETAQRLKAKIRYFEVAVERAGTCCVEPSTLETSARPIAH